MLHGGGTSGTIWDPVRGLLANDFTALAPTLVGHRDGGPLPDGPVTIDTYVDSAEAAMDAAGWDQAHIVGSSMGGWTAMELARRGRAKSVVAFSPAGGWPNDPSEMRRVARFFKSARRNLQLGKPLVRQAFRSRLVRKYALLGTSQHGDRISVEQGWNLLDDAVAYDMRMLGILDTGVRPIPDPGIPALIVWAETDRLIPHPTFSDPWREAAPWAGFQVMSGVGHSVMYDDPEGVAEIIRSFVPRN